jgi:hypothetical protein
MLLPELLQSLCVETHSDHADSAGWQAETPAPLSITGRISVLRKSGAGVSEELAILADLRRKRI